MTTENKSSSNVALNKPYARKLTPDETGGYVATIHEFPGCIAYGATPDEAIRKLEDVAESWLEAATESNYSVPEPANYESASGRIALRISRRVHQLAAERADLEGTSLNQFIATALASYLGQQQGIDAVISAAKDELQAACNRLTSTFSQQSLQTFYVKLDWTQPLFHEETRDFIELPMTDKTYQKESWTGAYSCTSLLT